MTKKTYNLSVKYRKEMKDYREEYGIPQWLLAEYMGISQSLVSHFEKNKTDYLLIDKDIIDACAKKYNRKKKTEVKKELNEPIQLNIGNADIERLQNNIDSVRKAVFAKIDRINKDIEKISYSAGKSEGAIIGIKESFNSLKDYTKGYIDEKHKVSISITDTLSNRIGKLEYNNNHYIYDDTRLVKGIEQAHQKIGQHTFSIEAVRRDTTEAMKVQRDATEALEIKLTKATSNMYIVMAIMFLATILIQVGMYYG